MGLCLSTDTQKNHDSMRYSNRDLYATPAIENPQQEEIPVQEPKSIDSKVHSYIPRKTSDVIIPPDLHHGRSRQYGVIDGAQQQEESDTFYYIYKDEETKKLIRMSMKSHPVFQNMEQIQIDRVIDAMDKVDVPKGAICSQQGKAGRSFYTIAEGQFSMKSVVTESQTISLTLVPGHSFGELFLFDTPRLYTVVAETPGVLWTIDRTGFRKTLEIYEKNKIKDRIKFLKRMEIFKPLVHDEFNKLAEACIQLYYKKNEIIIREGELVDEHSYFFIIESGRVKVNLAYQSTSKDEKYTVLKTGAFFGERSLITDEPRSTDVTAMTNVILLALDRASFIKLLGPIEPILNRTIDTYGVVALKDIPVLSFLTNEERERLYRLMVKKNYKSGDIIYHIGDNVNFNIIMEGEVIRTMKDDDFDDLKLKRIASSDGFATSQNDPFASRATSRTNSPRNDKIRAINGSIGPDSLPGVVNEPSTRVSMPGQSLLPNPYEFAAQTSNPLQIQKTSIKAGIQEHNPKTLQRHQSETRLSISNINRVRVAPARRQSCGVGPNRLVHDLLMKGDYFGGTSIIRNNSKSLCKYTAKENVTCLTLDAKTFHDYIMKNPSSKKFLKQFINPHHNKEEEENGLEKRKPTKDGQINDVKHFKIIQPLGKGAFGLVILVEDKKHRQYAIKCVKRTRLIDEKGKSHRDAIVSVLQEKKILTQLPVSPFIERFYGTCVDDNYCYYIIEFINGGELHYQMYSDVGDSLSMDEESVQFYVSNIVVMLSDLHDEKIAYRDLKPENLVIDKDTGYLKLIDFGFAKQIFRKTWTICGTPYYIAPEIICCTGHDTAVDWWTLGIICYELIAGVTPFSGENPLQTYNLILNGELDFSTLTISENLQDLIIRLLQRSKTLRLGNLQRGAKDIFEHPFFEKLNWDDIRNRSMKAPKLKRPVETKQSPCPEKIVLGSGSGDWVKGTKLENF